jgi:hypothetical protein
MGQAMRLLDSGKSATAGIVNGVDYLMSLAKKCLLMNKVILRTVRTPEPDVNRDIFDDFKSFVAADNATLFNRYGKA